MFNVKTLIHFFECINFHNQEIDSVSKDLDNYFERDEVLCEHFKKNIDYHSAEKNRYYSMIEDVLNYKIDYENNVVNFIIDDLNEIKLAEMKFEHMKEDSDLYAQDGQLDSINELWQKFNNNYKHQ